MPPDDDSERAKLRAEIAKLQAETARSEAQARRMPYAALVKVAATVGIAAVLVKLLSD